VKAELFYGALRSDRVGENVARIRRFASRFPSLPFDDAAAATHARIRSELASRGELIGAHDLLIASIALTHRVTVVTHNMAEFSRVKGLQLEDWETDE
jgi:tRNA(fMet)-specific endonuclease VapC